MDAEAISMVPEFKAQIRSGFGFIWADDVWRYFYETFEIDLSVEHVKELRAELRNDNLLKEDER